MTDILGGFVVPAAGLLLQGVVGWTLLQVVRGEVNLLRQRAHEHAQMLTEHEAKLEDHQREIDRLRDLHTGRRR